MVEYSPSIQVAVGEVTNVEMQLSSTPHQFELQPAFPNPFSAGGGSLPAGWPACRVSGRQTGAYGGNFETTIRYNLPKSGEVSLKVYDLSGREVATLAEGHCSPGQFQLTWNAADIPSATYLVVLRSGAEMQVQKVVVLK